MIREASDRQRSDAAWLWGFAAEALTPEPLLALLSDPVAFRAAAVGSLSSFKGREDVFAGLVQALDDADERVTCSAAAALGHYGDRRAIPALRKLSSGSPEVAPRIVQYALQQLGR